MNGTRRPTLLFRHPEQTENRLRQAGNRVHLSACTSLWKVLSAKAVDDRDANRVPEPIHTSVVHTRVHDPGSGMVRGTMRAARPPAEQAQVWKNANQTRPRIKSASPVEMAIIASTDGPGSPWRASVGVSMIC